MLGAVISLIATIITAYYLIKRYQAQIVLLVAGLGLMLVAVLLLGAGPEAILPAKVKSTGFIGFDLVKFVERTFSARVAGLGLIIMSAGGFATYMDHIGASKAMVFSLIGPLQKLRSPYLVLALAFIIGSVLKIFITSASGLSMLLMVTIYPVIVALGASPVAAAAMVVTCGAFDTGPAGGNSNLGAASSSLDIMVYFVNYQLPATVAGWVTMAVLHYFSQQYFDKKDKIGALYGTQADNRLDTDAIEENKVAMPPKFYVILPALPLILLLVFSSFGYNKVKLDVVTAMLLCFLFTICCEFIRFRDARKVFKDSMVFYMTMGKMFGAVITMVVAGEVFAKGLMATGTIDLLINTAKGAGFGPFAMTLTMTLFIIISAIVMGGGNAPFFAFAALAPKIAGEVGFPAVYIVLPMQLSCGICRTITPISAVMIAVSGVAGIHPFDLLRRTIIPAGGGLIVSTIVALAIG